MVDENAPKHLSNEEPMKAVILDETGDPDILSVSEIQKPSPSPTEVLVEIEYSGINYADLISRQGMYSWAPERPYILGLEAAGTIVEVGSEVKHAEIGDRVVVGTQQGGYAEYITVQEDYILQAPEQFNWKECAAFGVNWFTAWVAIHEMARARKGETLLVQAAAGGVGTAAVQLGIAHNMTVFGTSSKAHKRKRVEELGATAFSYENFDEKIRGLDKRPDCIIESVGGDVYERSFDLLAPMGRIVVIGASSININKWNPISWYRAWKALPRAKMTDVLHRSRGFMGLHLGYLLKNVELLRPSWEEMIQVVTEHDLHPEIRDDQIYPMSEVSNAHQLIHDRKNIGKVLLDPSK